MIPHRKGRLYQEKAPAPFVETDCPQYSTGLLGPLGSGDTTWGKSIPNYTGELLLANSFVICKTRVLLAVFSFKGVSKNNRFSSSKCIANRVKSGFLGDYLDSDLLFSQRWRLGGEGRRAVMSLFDSSFHF